MLKQMRIAYAARLITPREREDAREVLFDNIISEVQALSRITSRPGPQCQELALLDGIGNVRVADLIEIPTLQRELIDELVAVAGLRGHDNIVNDTVE